ncbi:MAG: radical SAM protein [Oscillospiraceae bacterium]|nr:radical SAM protein [Oscillospiraceae bacterium]
MSARERIIPVFVPHVGCPNNCVFCNQRKISGQLIPAGPENVTKAIEEAASLIPDGGKPQLAFYGGSFTAIPAEQQIALLSAAYRYIESGFLESVRVSTRPDAVDTEILERLQSYGVRTVEIGAQSLDSEVLLKSGRGHTAKDVFKAAELVKSFGFRLVIQMMTGLPGDTLEKSVKTAEDICRIAPYGVRIYPTVIIKDTALYDLWRAGRYKEHTVEDAVNVCSRIVPLFEKNGIEVIRIGLNPTDDLSSGEAAGGAYHPALGELVRSRILLDRMRIMLKGVQEGSSAVFRGPAKLHSQMIGQHRQNLNILKNEFSLERISVSSSEDNEIRVEITD